MKTFKIRVKSNNQVYSKDWPKVEALPFGGQYANKHNGFNDHIDGSGIIYRVYFPTALKKKNIVKQ